jgi:site-specific DNA-methyltransferase (adenine-specific)/modification methylase
MVYLSSFEVSQEWNISERRIVQLCLSNRVQGAVKAGRTWSIPASAKKPTDSRIRSGKYIKSGPVDSINKILNSVFQADCLEMMKQIPDESIDMILCDLPYGITQNKWDCYVPLDALWKQYNRIIKPRGVIALTSSGVFTAKIILSQEKLFKYKWIWEKSKPTNFLNAKKQPLRKHEDVCVFYKKQPIYHPQMTQGEAYDKGVRKNQLSGSYGNFQPVHVQSSGDRYPIDIIYVKTAESEGKVVHPTQKPIELGRYLIRTYTNEGDIVLDNTCGSGSFLVSALLEKRNFIGIEKNENVSLFKEGDIDYIQISKDRLKAAWKTLSLNEKNILVQSNIIKEFFDEESRI